MALDRATGFQGACALPTGYNAYLNDVQFKVAKVVHLLTQFGETWAIRKTGVRSLDGTASGVMVYDAANTNPGFGLGATLAETQGGSMTITIAPSCTLSFTGVIGGITAGSNLYNTGNTIAYEFGNSGTVTLAWDETP